MTRAGSPAAFPARPSDVPDLIPLPRITEALGEHRSRLVSAQHGLGEQQSNERLAGHALASLVLGHALAERALCTRWVAARDALAHGATTAQEAAAMGVEPDEVTFGLLGWADGQVRVNAHYGAGGLTPAQADEVRALVAGGAR